MWVLTRFVFLGLVFLFRAFWRRQGVDQAVLYRGTRRVTFKKKDKIYWGLKLNPPAGLCAQPGRRAGPRVQILRVGDGIADG